MLAVPSLLLRDVPARVAHKCDCDHGAGERDRERTRPHDRPRRNAGGQRCSHKSGNCDAEIAGRLV
jgi:hypothetical protein